LLRTQNKRIKQAPYLQEMMDNQDFNQAAEMEDGSVDHHLDRDTSATTMSGIRAQNDSEDDDDDADDDEQVMTPRGVYVQRCLCVLPLPMVGGRSTIVSV
jgi:hypothetical protein